MRLIIGEYNKLKGKGKPRVLLVTPEITELPEGMGNIANYIRAKGGGMADISAGLVDALFNNPEFEVHLTIPYYESNVQELQSITESEILRLPRVLKEKAIHLVRDSAFTRLGVYDTDPIHSSISKSLAFQRYIINVFLDEIQPDIVHCNDWMTALVPAAAKQRGIKSLFTLHNVFTELAQVRRINQEGISANQLKENLYFRGFPSDNLEELWGNLVDFTASGVFSSDAMNTVSKGFLEEIVTGEHQSIIPASVRRVVQQKYEQGRAYGILNAPNDKVHPDKSPHLKHKRNGKNMLEWKAHYKKEFQKATGLSQDLDSPLLFWPHRLYLQKGPELLCDLALHFINKYHAQIGVVANGDQSIEKRLIELSNANPNRIAFHSFNEALSEYGKAGADYMLMPSRYEPSGLPQMECPRYGTLPVVRLTGGLKDTVKELDIKKNTGNGFTFKAFTKEALARAVDRAIKNFYYQPEQVKTQILQRISDESIKTFSFANTAKQYMEIYEQLFAER